MAEDEAIPLNPKNYTTQLRHFNLFVKRSRPGTVFFHSKTLMLEGHKKGTPRFGIQYANLTGASDEHGFFGSLTATLTFYQDRVALNNEVGAITIPENIWPDQVLVNRQPQKVILRPLHMLHASGQLVYRDDKAISLISLFPNIKNFRYAPIVVSADISALGAARFKNILKQKANLSIIVNISPKLNLAAFHHHKVLANTLLNKLERLKTWSVSDGIDGLATALISDTHPSGVAPQEIAYLASQINLHIGVPQWLQSIESSKMIYGWKLTKLAQAIEANPTIFEIPRELYPLPPRSLHAFLDLSTLCRELGSQIVDLDTGKLGCK